ncbi:hypothetical protein HK102_004541, partial [Quaeritorhiza haematococci]
MVHAPFFEPYPLPSAAENEPINLLGITGAHSPPTTTSGDASIRTPYSLEAGGRYNILHDDGEEA